MSAPAAEWIAAALFGISKRTPDDGHSEGALGQPAAMFVECGGLACVSLVWRLWKGLCVKDKRKREESPETAGAASLFDPAIQFLDSGTDNDYAEAVGVRHRVDSRAQKIFVMGIVLAVIYVLALILPDGIVSRYINYGSYSIAAFIDGVSTNISEMLLELSGTDVPWARFSSNMIKFVVVAISGAGLALCGAVYQGSFRNALVSPSTLGVMSGGSLGLALWIALCVSDEGNVIIPFVGEVAEGAFASDYGEAAAWWSSYSMVLFSFVGCLLVVAIVLGVMRFSRNRTISPILMIITGQIVAGVAGAVVSSIRYYYVALDPFCAKADMFTSLMVSSFWRHYTWVDIVSLLVPICVVFAVVMHLRQKMMALAFDEAERRSMGIESRRTQVIVVGLCTLLTAIIISFCGVVGFVGFLVPHLARRLVGPNFRYLLPASLVLGAVFVLGSYELLIFLLGTDFDTMVGMFVSIGGAAVFLVSALRGKGVSNGQFR